MKLQKIHLFIIILLVIIASSFGFVVREYMQNREVVTLGDDNLDREKESESIWNRRRGGGGGIPRSEIPEGDEDLYILKSQVVPPVCPKCPDNRSCPRSKPCAPCKPCGRCPEPTEFECKKVKIKQGGIGAASNFNENNSKTPNNNSGTSIDQAYGNNISGGALNNASNKIGQEKGVQENSGVMAKLNSFAQF